MPQYFEQRILPYNTLQMFDLVADIEKYPEFIPWVSAARILERKQNELLAQLAVKFKAVRSKYTSKVSLERPVETDYSGLIYVRLVEGPFKHLENEWKFEPIDDGSCCITFDINFQFHSAMFEKMIGSLFNKAVRKMTNAFEQRAEELYGGCK